MTTNPSNIHDPLLVDIRVASRMLGISQRTLHTMAISGEIPSVRMRRRRLYDPDALREWIERAKESTGSEGQS